MALKTKHAKQVAQPDQFLTTSMQAVTWLEQNRRLVFGGFAVVILLGVAWIAFGHFSERGRAQVTRRVTAALEAESAEVVAEPPAPSEDGPPEEPALTFRSEKQRAETLVRRYRRVIEGGGSAELLAFAHVGLAGAYGELGRHDQARKEYEAAIEAGVEEAVPFALEGLIYELEALDKRREAQAKLDELKTIQDGKFRNLATYHIARLEIAAGRKAQALETLRHLQRDLAETPELAFLREQASALATQLESEGVIAATSSDDAAPDKRAKNAKKKGGGRRGGEGGGDEE